MKKKIVFISVVIIAVLLLLFLSITNSKRLFSNSSDLPSPTLYAFEDQKILSDYYWSLIGLSGKSFDMVTKRGNVLLIHFWSVENKESVETLETINELYEDYKTKIEFIAIAKDKQPDVRAFLDKSNYYFPVCYSLSIAPKPIENKVAKTYLISKKGRILIEHEGSANWNSDEVRKIIDGLLKQ